MPHPIEQEDRVNADITDIRLLKRLAALLRPHLGLFAMSLLASLVTAGGELVGPLIIKTAVDRSLVALNAKDLGVLILLYVCAALVKSTALSAAVLFTSRLGQNIMLKLRTRLFSHLLRLPTTFFDKTPLGRPITRLTNDVEQLNDLLSSGFVSIIFDILLFVGTLTTMFLLNWKLTLVCFSVLPLSITAILIYRYKVRRIYLETRKQIARINSFLQENITGMAVVQLFQREKRNFEQFRGINDAFCKPEYKGFLYESIYFPAVNLTTFISIAAILLVGGLMVWDGQTTFGVLAAFIQYVRRFFQPLDDLAGNFALIQSSTVAGARIFALMDEAEEQSFIEPKAALPSPCGRIKYCNLTFSYIEETVLKDISFDIRYGEKIAIVGATGAGKTSIINLLNRLYEPAEGQIFIEGRNIRNVPLPELRRRIGVVQQEAFIFSGSVRENITLGREGFDEVKLNEIAGMVNLQDFINDLPNRFDYQLAERGANLSAGQKQLLSFARVLADNPDILVLDEATSSVDTDTENLIRDAIHRLLQNRTSIIIAHRLSTILHVDRIIVLHKGVIREVGSHKELMDRGGIYYHLYKLQFQNNDY